MAKILWEEKDAVYFLTLCDYGLSENYHGKKDMTRSLKIIMGIQIPKCYSHSFETCAWIKCTDYVAFWTEFAHLHSAGRLSFLYPEVGCSIWQQQGIKKYKRVLAYFCSLRDLPTYLVKTILSVKMHSKRDDCYLYKK